MNVVPPDLLEILQRQRQEHLLAGWESLTLPERSALIKQLRTLDFELLAKLYQKRANPLPSLLLDAIQPIAVEAANAASVATIAIGEDALRRGEVAALLVAGGQGSRLGFDKPKGMYPVGPVSGASLFQIHAEKVLALSRRYGRPVPFLVMTSPATDADTKAYFAEHRHFGLDPAEVHFFEQGMMPALDIETGRLILEKPGTIFLSPNGHGGTLTALAESGLLAQMRRRGIRQVFYFQVDNPLVSIGDPAFVGRHIETEAEVSSKVVFKERPEEKVGVLALVEGRKAIVEYSDLPKSMTEARDGMGSLKLRAGNPAIHLFSVDFLERLTARTGKSGGLSFHLAKKKVPYFDAVANAVVVPTSENALKFEMFIFDALPLADRWLVMQTIREDEFAPLKNADGPDSPRTVHELIVGRAIRWFRDAGVRVPEGVAVEIAPTFALDANELRAKLPASFKIEGPTHLR